MAGRIRIAGYFCIDEGYFWIAGYFCIRMHSDRRLFGRIRTHSDTSAPGRDQLRNILAGKGPSWAHTMRELSDSEPPPAEGGSKRSTAFKEVDICSAFLANKALRSIGDIYRPRQDAVNMLPGATFTRGQQSASPVHASLAAEISGRYAGFTRSSSQKGS